MINPTGSDDNGVSRRKFLATAAMLAAGSMVSWRRIGADEVVKDAASSETLVGTLYKGLSEKQKKTICFPFDHALRSEVDNNWQITESTVGELFNADQQDLIRQIFMGLHSEEYAKTVVRQVDEDSDGQGLSKSAIAIFGEPGTGKFEFVLTGRHCTRRCDGDSVDGAAFGGPIFYGHAGRSFFEDADHPGNVYWYQAKRANELFQALDGKQRKVALLGDPRKENGVNTVKLAGANGKLSGLPASEMSKDQRELMRKVMADVLAPFRKKDVDESMKLIEASDGFEKLHMSYYKNMDIGNDGVWDVWQIEGPGMVWCFRGKPHVHVWVNVAAQA